jgi:hypothetical protein
MITNNSVTIYHYSGINQVTHDEMWTKYVYSNVWFFGGEGAKKNKGYDNANDFDCRISYQQNEGLDINNFSKGDYVVAGTLDFDITSPLELKNYKVYNILSITDNNFGNNPHIHIGGE